ncbi:acyl-CoA reductase-like NAD-dependent aldehyde dehydrogenase [Edaphobacter lichenicola]|uniref:Acyl-CoA reductase-like NAD-dependent aldehyde dehydrogenase n=1 Tax=Tunturiibacter lichenicola TaxID=2051959 RepID=A0A7Y9T545_9BACT|nr:acyl-CoA reductase-like NAD-dependent aldehyde dehydrogenase [Edaphobacter lichenicola]
MPYLSVNPATGEVPNTFTEQTDQEMMDALATADKAFLSWAPAQSKSARMFFPAILSFCMNGRGISLC